MTETQILPEKPTIAPPPGWGLEISPFHAGELAIQDRVGVRARIDIGGRKAMRRYLTAQHLTFFPQLPFVFVGSVDAQGQPWASLLAGEPGFLATPDDQTFRVHARPFFGDPLGAHLREGMPVAALGVELPTRRRNRVIGHAVEVGPDGFRIAIDHTLGVCPQYIQSRDAVFTRDPMMAPERPVHCSTTLDAAARAIIARADTYLVASHDPRAEDGITGGADISHRGGRPGFVFADDDRTLTAPDFVGNYLFNTLGNFVVDPRAGLLFVDFETGDTLQITATAEVIWDGPEVSAFAGAQRLVRYTVDQVIRIEGALPMRFSGPVYSPILERTGTWEEAHASLEAATLAAVWRPFRVRESVAESSTVRSFYLEPADGHGVAPYQAGQFLPIRVNGETRTYTLSDAPNGRDYRISVKREQAVSVWLHEHAAEGTQIEALAPRGTFVFDAPPNRPVVMISAGIGITPLLSMLNSLLVNEGRTRHQARIHFIHGTRDAADMPFAAHLRRRAALHSTLSLHIRASAPTTGHDSEGRIDAALLQSLLPLDDYEVFLCGPAGFMQSLYDTLLGLGIRDERIHFESFGPASVRRRRAEAAPDSSEGVVVQFARSGKSALWRPDAGSLLDLAEASGLTPLSSCRSGVCGTCSTRVIAGSVDYATPPAHDIEPGEALICCATPHAGPHLDDGTANREGISLDL